MGQINTTVINNVKTESIPTYTGVDPTWTGVYFQAIVDAPGTVASNSYISVLNPSGSGKLAIALGFIATNYATGTVTAAASMKVFRISAHSVGTDIAAASVNRFVSSFPDPISQVKIGNPTVTITNGTNPMLGIAPSLGPAAQAPATIAPTPGASFTFLPGEGIVFQVANGNANQLWNLQYIWAERPI